MGGCDFLVVTVSHMCIFIPMRKCTVYFVDCGLWIDVDGWVHCVLCACESSIFCVFLCIVHVCVSGVFRCVFHVCVGLDVWVPVLDCVHLLVWV